MSQPVPTPRDAHPRAACRYRGRRSARIIATLVGFALLQAGTAVAADYSAVVAADAPRAYWRLGEATGTVAADQVANRNPGAYVSGVVLGQPGAIGGDASTAVTLDGTNEYVNVTDSDSLDLTAGATLEAWVKRTGSGFQVIFGKPGNGQSRHENYSLWFDNGNYLRAYFGNGSTYATASSPVAIDTGWHHVVATYDNATVRLYVDAQQVDARTSAVQLTPNAD